MVIPPIMFRDFTRMVNDRFPADVAGVVALRRESGGSPSNSALIQMRPSKIIQIV
jgi:hypothetical protein